MKKFFVNIIAVIIAVFFSGIALAQTNQTAKHRPAVKRGVVETAPKRMPVAHSRIVTAPAKKPLAKTAARKTAVTHTARSKPIVKGKQGKNGPWKIVLNPFVMIIWIPLLLSAIAIVVQLYRLFPRREEEEDPAMAEEKADEGETTTWDQRLWDRIKEFFRRLRKKPVLAAG